MSTSASKEEKRVLPNVHMRPHRQFVDNLSGIALPNCLMLGTNNPPGVPRCVEFSMLLRGWNCISGFAG